MQQPVYEQPVPVAPQGYPPMAGGGYPQPAPMGMPQPVPVPTGVPMPMPMPQPVVIPAVPATGYPAMPGGFPAGNMAIPNGAILCLQPLHAGGTLVVDCSRGGNNNGTKLLLWSNNQQQHQKFRLSYSNNGSVSFNPMHAPNMAIDVTRNAGAQCILWKSKNGNANQDFFLEPTAQQNVFFLRSAALPGQYLTCDLSIGGGRGSNLTTGPNTGAPNVMWMITPA
jgi:hypothetical protein